MRKCLLILLSIANALICTSQENEPVLPSEIEQQLENYTEANDAEVEDDSFLQQLKYYLRNPLNVNEATLSDFRELQLLSELQIYNLIVYRNLLGTLLSVYELQAVPSWDILTIRKVIPYIIVSETRTILQSLKERAFVGESDLLFQSSIIVPKAKGFNRGDSITNFYKGSRHALISRYKYNYKNLLQYGFTADKDAGEQFFKGSQKQGFDFYSLHVFARKVGIIKSVVLGDFTVNFGQGLIHWQRFAFRKSAAAVSVKRQSEVLQPYSSAGEYNFHRGVGITFEKKNWEASAFGSYRKFSSTSKYDSIQEYVSSVVESGMHRTPAELENRNNLAIVTMGSNLIHRFPRGQVGINWVQYFFSKPFASSGRPYDLFAMEGKQWMNMSLHYDYTVRNIHLFGESALDRNSGVATINGLMASVDPSVDIAFVYRRIDKQYQSYFGNAFTESVAPSNESGLYAGISIRPAHRWKIDGYVDIYRFPWLLFRADAPSFGNDYLVQVHFTPKKTVELSLRIKTEAKQLNVNGDSSVSPVGPHRRASLRYDISYKLNHQLSIRSRIEACTYRDEMSIEQGYLAYVDFGYKVSRRPWSFNGRIQYFEADGYNARIYAYETNPFYGTNSPAFFDQGFRLYLIARTDVSKFLKISAKARDKLKLQAAIKYAYSYYFKLDKIGSELNEIQGHTRTEIRGFLLFSR